jgi:protein-S-isoprenylcysteine O-methyltransferase Ste14
MGVAVAFAGIFVFRLVHTTINPHRPAKASRLVTGSVYRFTRNPRYLGMPFAPLAWSSYLGSLLPLLFMPLFLIYLTRFQIVPEEQVLLWRFGRTFHTYRRKVRCWLWKTPLSARCPCDHSFRQTSAGRAL